MPMYRRGKTARPRVFSLLELLAIVTILGLIAIIVIPRISIATTTARTKVDARNKVFIDSAVERWYFENGTWPADDLSDIGADKKYFPSGLPTSPTSKAAYSLNPTTHRVN